MGKKRKSLSETYPDINERIDFAIDAFTRVGARNSKPDSIVTNCTDNKGRSMSNEENDYTNPPTADIVMDLQQMIAREESPFDRLPFYEVIEDFCGVIEAAFVGVKATVERSEHGGRVIVSNPVETVTLYSFQFGKRWISSNKHFMFYGTDRLWFDLCRLLRDGDSSGFFKTLLGLKERADACKVLQGGS